jgi:hypothetical protein
MQKKLRCINVVYHFNIQGKVRNKVFLPTDIKKAMDYVLTIDDLYINSCPEEVRDWCETTDHDILSKKSWVFA